MQPESLQFRSINTFLFHNNMQSPNNMSQTITLSQFNMKESCMDEAKEDSLWIYCPVCGGKTRTKVCKETVLVKFPLYCPKCKKEIKIDVVQLKIVVSE